MMIKHLTRHGNSLALVIDKGILELLGIDAKTPLAVTTDGKVLVVSAARDEKRRKKVGAVMDKIEKRYERVFRRLSE